MSEQEESESVPANVAVEKLTGHTKTLSRHPKCEVRQRVCILNHRPAWDAKNRHMVAVDELPFHYAGVLLYRQSTSETYSATTRSRPAPANHTASSEQVQDDISQATETPNEAPSNTQTPPAQYHVSLPKSLDRPHVPERTEEET